MTGWLVSNVPWWAWAIFALVVIAAVQRLFGWQVALGALAAAVGWIAYRKGSDDAGREVRKEVVERQEQSQEKIHAEEEGAIAAGRAAAERVRNAAGAADRGNDGTG